MPSAATAGRPLAEPEQPDAQGQADQPHVLDARVGEHALHVALVQGQRDPDQGREQAERGKGQPPPWGGRAEEGQDAQEPVEAHLDHHARHQGGDVRGSGRMGFGQPDVERNKARFRPEADQGEDEDQPRPERLASPASSRRPRIPGCPRGAPGARKSQTGKRPPGGSRPDRPSPPGAPRPSRARTSPGKRPRATSPPTTPGTVARSGRSRP